MVHHNSDQATVVNNSLRLNNDHYGQITIDRGIDGAWASASCQSVDIDKASVILGYTAKSPGIAFFGAGSGLQAQFKPDTLWTSKDGKKPKYLTPIGDYDAFLPKHPTDKGYWGVEALKQVCLRINDHPYILITEGCFKAISGCSNGLPTVALMGVTMGLTPKDKQGKRCLVHELKKLAEAGFGFIITFDADAKTNKNVRWEEQKLTKELLEFNVPVLSVTGTWNIEDGKGMDDFIQKKGIEEFRRILAKAYAIESHDTVDESHQKHEGSESDYIPSSAPSSEDNYILKAQAALYSDGHWVSICGRLYRFTGSHYEEVNEAVEQRRISEWLKTYSEKVKGRWIKNKATPGCINEVYNWIVKQVAVDSDKINLDGLNCSNGVVKINSDGSHSLVQHDPNQVYTYVGGKYDPDADATDCNRLLECLEPPQREIFLRTASAALNLKLVRSKLGGRAVKGLLCQGEGSNGKDTLRAVLAEVFGRGMTGKSLSDYKSYDGGRKFALSRLEGGICNWASENASSVNLDSLQSLKQFITGDPIEIERKGKDSYEYKPEAIFLANCNKLPSITGGTAAIDDRYGILSFKKTYKRGAVASQGELEADPRFKDDESFILERIAPAMLNKMLERFPLLLAEGIDYDATREVMQDAQEKSNHLWQFTNDVGIKTQAGGRIYIKDLWQKMQDWYVEQGILEIEYTDKGKEKLVWNDLPNKYDKPVKATNQVFARLCEIFPKLARLVHTEGGSLDPRKGQAYLSGITFAVNPMITEETALLALLAVPERDTALPTALLESTSKATSDATPHTQKPSKASKAVLPVTDNILQLIQQIRQVLDVSDQSEARKLAKNIKADVALGEQVKATLSLEENHNFKTLANTGLIKGMRVSYVGDNANCTAQYGKLDLVVDEIRFNTYGVADVACLKPDGSYATWINHKDLKRV
ncbi:DUF3854 domain-containing protein [Microcoleus sp.]